MKKKHAFKMLIVSVLVVFFMGSVSLGSEAVDESKWDKAGKEAQEATEAVVEATKDLSQEAWQKTKEGSGEIYEKAMDESQELWDKTKEKSGETWEKVKVQSFEAWEKTKAESTKLYEKTKSDIHEATAPDPGEGNPDPVK